MRLEEPHILLVAGKCSQIRELLPLLGSVAESGKPLLLIAEDFASDVLTLLVINSLRGVFRVAAVKAPGFGDRRNDILTDLGIVTGGTVIAKSTGLTLEKTTLQDLGTARQVLVSRDRTTIIDGGSESKLCPEAVSH